LTGAIRVAKHNTLLKEACGSLKIRPRCLWQRTCLILTLFKIKGGWVHLLGLIKKMKYFVFSVLTGISHCFTVGTLPNWPISRSSTK
jgi:hypothetical protein